MLLVQQLISLDHCEVRCKTGRRIEHKAPVPSKEAIRALIEAAEENLKPHLIVSALGGSDYRIFPKVGGRYAVGSPRRSSAAISPAVNRSAVYGFPTTVTSICCGGRSIWPA